MTTGHGGKPPVAGTGRQDEIEQAAARAAAYIERYFEGTPKAAELVKACCALDDAIALSSTPDPRDALSLEHGHASIVAG